MSPATVAAAYRTLKQRGLVSTNRRRGTVVAAQPPLRVIGGPPLPPNTRDLASGNPDPAMLPPLGPALARIDAEHKLYGGPIRLPRLVELAEADLSADGIDGDIAIVGGALDGIERVLQTQLRPGDRVVVEDPSWPRIVDLLYALGLEPEPARVDERGLVPRRSGARSDVGARRSSQRHAARIRQGPLWTPNEGMACARSSAGIPESSSSRTTTSPPWPERPMSGCTRRVSGGQ